MFSVEFTDFRADVLEVWQGALAGQGGTRFARRAKDAGVDARPSADAIALPATLAHQRFGGMPVIGRAQVLRNRRGQGGESGGPKWVVTTVPFPVELSPGHDESGAPAWKVVPGSGIDPSKESFLLFKGMFRAVEDHNDVYGDDIKSLSIDLAVIGMSAKDPLADARSARDALRLQGGTVSPSRDDGVIASGFGTAFFQGATRLDRDFPSSGRPTDLVDLSSGYIPQLRGVRSIYFNAPVKRTLADEDVGIGEIVEAILRAGSGEGPVYAYPPGGRARGLVMTFVTSKSARVTVSAAYNEAYGVLYLQGIELER